MLTIDSLISLLPVYVEGLKSELIIDSPDGLEGFVEICQRKQIPYCVLFEDAFHFDDNDMNDVPTQTFTQSIYVLRMVPGNEPSRTYEDMCLSDCRKIRNVLLAHSNEPQIEGWNKRPQRDFVRGASNYVGWKLRLTFTDNDDWTVEPLQNN